MVDCIFEFYANWLKVFFFCYVLDFWFVCLFVVCRGYICPDKQYGQKKQEAAEVAVSLVVIAFSRYSLITLSDFTEKPKFLDQGRPWSVLQFATKAYKQSGIILVIIILSIPPLHH